MPCSLMRWPWISMVSASITEATPICQGFGARERFGKQTSRSELDALQTSSPALENLVWSP